ncbi:hypothetical protein ACFL5O_05800 [Myxococcota bacterium]
MVTTTAEILPNGDGIVLIRFREGIAVDTLEAREIVAATQRVAGTTAHGNLVDARTLTHISKGACEVFACQNRRSVSGVAVLAGSSLQRTMANLYLSVARPKIPTRRFTTERAAADWLHAQNQRLLASLCLP